MRIQVARPLVELGLAGGDACADGHGCRVPAFPAGAVCTCTCTWTCARATRKTIVQIQRGTIWGAESTLAVTGKQEDPVHFVATGVLGSAGGVVGDLAGLLPRPVDGLSAVLKRGREVQVAGHTSLQLVEEGVRTRAVPACSPE
eukprot:58105-Prorocentrum_minimum.AAC.1